ncbi:MAG: OmpA family protein [Bacteroidota bacterium]|nr:OmpA family protein [Bacteroidota bacterium]|tara:strand:- start:6509 stop:7504 length:996 start_codon:yes stop_codon:yes gene_type:complete
MKSLLYILLVITLLASCVTPKIHNTLIEEHEKVKQSLTNEEKKNLVFQTNLEESESKIKRLTQNIDRLKNDSAKNSEALSSVRSKYKSLSESYDLLASKNSRFMSNKAKEIKNLLEQLEQAENEIFTKEDQLNKVLKSLKVKEDELKIAQENLKQRSIRVSELEEIINKKDSLVSVLKKSISRALTGLEGEGLTIEQRNGKVYISLEEDLLFASGRYNINQNGISALNKLSNALENQQNLEILVEGHTDSIPLNGKGAIKDNWDLSVKRATSVVKVLLTNSNLLSSQFTAAGRAEFYPIASNATKEGRSANRRIEMILSPNLDDLYELLDQ